MLSANVTSEQSSMFAKWQMNIFARVEKTRRMVHNRHKMEKKWNGAAFHVCSNVRKEDYRRERSKNGKRKRTYK